MNEQYATGRTQADDFAEHATNEEIQVAIEFVNTALHLSKTEDLTAFWTGWMDGLRGKNPFWRQVLMDQQRREQEAEEERAIRQAEDEAEARSITPLERESWQWLGSACDQTCSVYGCEKPATWKRTYQSPSMAAAGTYYHCEEHAKDDRRGVRADQDRD
jgi:hypothetical protein